MIYLDNSATSSIDPEVLDAMLPYLREEYGNPSSKYYTLAENAHRAVEESRKKVASYSCRVESCIKQYLLTYSRTAWRLGNQLYRLLYRE